MMDIKNKIIITALVCLSILGFFLIPPIPASADTSMPDIKNPFDSLQIKIPNMDKFTDAKICKDDQTKICFPWLGEYIIGIYKYAISIVGILATIVMMIGGFMWLLAGGNPSKISEAKSWISASLTGLIIALSSYLILYQINPNLVKFEALKVKFVKPEEAAVGAGTCGGFNAINAGPCTDSSQKLSQYLTELEPKLKTMGIKTNVTGLSDSAGLALCRDSYKKPPCHHSQNSCHYGCGSKDGSYAVDFQCTGQTCYSTLEIQAKLTKNYKKHQCEDKDGYKISCSANKNSINHIHIEVK